MDFLQMGQGSGWSWIGPPKKQAGKRMELGYFDHVQPQPPISEYSGMVSSSSSSTSSLAPTDLPLIGGVYQVLHSIGAGSFGDVYMGLHCLTKERVAIKFEKISERLDSSVIGLHQESRILFELQGAQGVPGWKYYEEMGGYRILVMELLGCSLENLRELCGGRLSLKTVLMLAEQLVTILEHIHSRNFIHRDLKPQNVLIGLKPGDSVINVVDFGLSKRYRNPHSFDHIPEPMHRVGMVGTALFASVKCQALCETSRRDDLESIVYMLILCLKGTLPWKGKGGKNQKAELALVKKIKAETSIPELCVGCPQVIKKILIHCRSLSFTESPDYHYLRQIIRHSMAKFNMVNDGIYDWVHLAGGWQQLASIGMPREPSRAWIPPPRFSGPSDRMEPSSPPSLLPSFPAFTMDFRRDVHQPYRQQRKVIGNPGWNTEGPPLMQPVGNLPPESRSPDLRSCDCPDFLRLSPTANCFCNNDSFHVSQGSSSC